MEMAPKTSISSGFSPEKSAMIRVHQEEINHLTDASAEAFNAEIKTSGTPFRGAVGIIFKKRRLKYKDLVIFVV
jgi:hypothetical protein